MKISNMQAVSNTAANKTENKNTTPEQDAALQKSAKELEGLFLSHVLQVMRKTIPKESGQSANMVDMMFSSIMGNGLAEQGGIGMSKFLYSALAENDIEAVDKLKNQAAAIHGLKNNLNTTEGRNDY